MKKTPNLNLMGKNKGIIPITMFKFSKNLPKKNKPMFTMGIPKKSKSLFSLTPSKSFLFQKPSSIKQQRWFTPPKKYPKSVYSKPFGDYDKDGVPNYLDCNPINPRQDGLGSTMKSIASGAKAAVTGAVKTVAKTYTAVDKFLGGALPGGAAAASKTAKVVEKALTTVITAPAKVITGPVATATKAIVTSIGGGGKSPASTTPSPKVEPTSTTPSTKPTAPSSGSGSKSIGEKLYIAADIATGGFLPGGVTPVTTKIGEKVGQLYTKIDTKVFGGALPGGAKPPQVTSKVTNIPAPKPTSAIPPPDKVPPGGPVGGIEPPRPPQPRPPRPDRREVQYVYYEEPAVETVQEPMTREQIISGLGSLRERIIPQATEKHIPEIVGAYEISPEQLFGSDILAGRYAKYPLILNINPLERTRAFKITPSLLRLQPRITYSTQIPTRLSIIAPVGTTKETAMARAGLSGSKYAEYVISMPTL